MDPLVVIVSLLTIVSLLGSAIYAVVDAFRGE
jgi:hypothetical protein